jgi:hypothetical protein
MKKLFILFAACCITVALMAQSSQLATLNHQGQISTFYGATALTKAHAAAVHGDVITLSVGSFNGVNITKAVTIRGAGIGMDSTTNALPTIINSDFIINVPAVETANLILEGIYHNGIIRYTQATRPMFIKCRFNEFSYQSSTNTLTDATFMHCKFVYAATLKGSGSLINSVINLASLISNYDITNCIILDEENTITNSTLTNCIIGVYDTPLQSSNFVNNSIGFASGIDSNYDGNDIFDELPISTTNSIVAKEDIFATFSYKIEDNVVLFPDDEWFKLTPFGKSYLGNDGTEVGIYGGNMPFDPRTTMPQITKCNVAAKSTADGKLSVDIEVSGIE